VDFNLPERFNVTYIAEDGNNSPAIMVHRALMGSLERFFGVLIEHYGGAFPLWLAPTQVIILTVTDRHDEWAGEVKKFLRDRGFRAEADIRNEKLGKKIREAQLAKIPYMLVVGDQEVKDKTVSPRTRGGEQFLTTTIENFTGYLEKEIKNTF
jgi:threonyl-tRNA synthetase